MRLSIFIAGLTTAIFQIGCGQDKSKPELTPVESKTDPPRAESKTQPPPAEKPVAPPAKVLTQEERNLRIAVATQGLELKRDKMEKVTAYWTRNKLKMMLLRNERLSASIYLPDGRPPTLHIAIAYSGDNWIFVDRVKVMSDDVVVYEKSFERSSVKRSGGHTVLESVEYPARSNDLDALRKIAGARSSMIRLYGESRDDDHELTANEIKDLKTIIEVFDDLSKLFPTAKEALEEAERP